MRTSLIVATCFGLGVLWAGPIQAATLVGVEGTKLIVVDKLTAATKAKTVYVSKDPAATKGSGTDVTQIEVDFWTLYGTKAEGGHFALPLGASDGTAGWAVNKTTVAKYVNKAAPAGATQTKVAVIKPGKLLKLVGKGLGDDALEIFFEGDPGVPGIETAYCVTNEGEEYCHCSLFTGCVYKLIAAGTGAKLVCKNGAPDPTCPASPSAVTTTTSSTTTTTTTSSSTTTTVGCVATSGCFCDKGDGTIHDTCENLIWEKKTNADGVADYSNPQDVDNTYMWSGFCSTSQAFCQPTLDAEATCFFWTGGAEGCLGEDLVCDVGEVCETPEPTIWEFLSELRNDGFAGSFDWQLPTMFGPLALFQIGDSSQGECGGGSGACIDPIFGPTATDSFGYWTSTTSSTDPERAWRQLFSDGLGGDTQRKWFDFSIRAVRPGP